MATTPRGCISLFFLAFATVGFGFTGYEQNKRFHHCPSPAVVSSSALHAHKKATLSEETEWSLRLVLKDLPTEEGGKANENFVLRVKFIEEEGYEPPQGSLAAITVEDSDRELRLLKSRWQLSEDPEDRKDGLWVWGLFDEPLYPFLLLRLETDTISLGDDATLPPLKLFAQIDHKRDPDQGVILSGTSLTVRKVETVNADPFGAAKVNLYDDVAVGRITVLPRVG